MISTMIVFEYGTVLVAFCNETFFITQAKRIYERSIQKNNFTLELATVCFVCDRVIALHASHTLLP
jgi:hypothetical protein